MYSIDYTGKFKKDLKTCQKRNFPLKEIYTVIELLSKTGALPPQYRPHKLSGNWQNIWECHIKPDWLLVWEQNDTELRLLMLRTGTHSDIF